MAKQDGFQSLKYHISDLYRLFDLLASEWTAFRLYSLSFGISLTIFKISYIIFTSGELLIHD